VKNIVLISTLLLLLLFGCDEFKEKYATPLGPFPTEEEGIIQELLEVGWAAYNAGVYDLAYAYFDYAVKMDAGNSWAYVGLGFSNMQLGSGDASRFDMAKSSFGFVPTLEGGSPIVEVLEGDLNFVYATADSSLFGLGVNPNNIPILGVFEPIVNFVPGSLSTAPEQELEVMRITENTIVTEVTEEGGELYIPQLGDSFEIDYAYFDGEVSPTLAIAFAGNAQTAQIQGKIEPEELLYAIIYAKAVLEEYVEDGSLRAVIPSYIDPDITSRNVRILLAQSYFYYGFLHNCMWELWELDPALKDSLNPDSPSFERDLQRFLEGI